METLNQLDEEASKLQKEGNYLEALKKVEQALIIRKSTFGSESEEVLTSSRQLCELCNLLAMVYLQKENFDLALDLLKKSETLSEGNEQCKAVTYNNMACFYRRVGKLRAALTYLQKALAIEARLMECESPADTHLNMCAVLSQLGKHDEALEHAMQALILLQEEIINKVLVNQTPQATKKFEDRAAVLAIAYHNMAVEYEFMKQFGEALAAYSKAFEFSQKHLGPQHAITNNLKGVYETAKSQMEELKNKEEKRKKTKIKTQGLQTYSKQMNREIYSSAGTRKTRSYKQENQYKENENNENNQQEVEHMSSSAIQREQMQQFTETNEMLNKNEEDPYMGFKPEEILKNNQFQVKPEIKENSVKNETERSNNSQKNPKQQEQNQMIGEQQALQKKNTSVNQAMTKDSILEQEKNGEKQIQQSEQNFKTQKSVDQNQKQMNEQNELLKKHSEIGQVPNSERLLQQDKQIDQSQILKQNTMQDQIPKFQQQKSKDYSNQGSEQQQIQQTKDQQAKSSQLNPIKEEIKST